MTRRVVLVLALSAALGSACRNEGVDAAGPPVTDPPPSDAPAPDATAPATVRSATGAVGGTPDDRIGPPGDGQPAVIPMAGGQCFNEVLDGSTNPPGQRFEIVDCAGPHDAEVFSATALDGAPGAPFPGEQALTREANRRCLAAFEPYVGLEYGRSELQLATMRPVARTWATGDRTLVCSLFDADLRPLHGSLQGSAR